MLASKTFYRKTKGGHIYKVVREHYLRDDIWCGSEACEKCGRRKKEILLDEENPGVKSTLYPHPYYLIFDTNIVLNQINILEEDILCNVIIPQTVLEEVRHRSSNVYKKLKELISDPKRKFYVFINEHHKDTFIERKPRETPNDKNDRAIRAVAKWYNSHLSAQKLDIKVILLTDDEDNKNKAAEDGIPVSTMYDYVSSLENAGFLVDKLSRKEYILDGEGRAPLFPCHLPPAQIHEGIKNGKLIQGTFLASRENFLEGSVNCEAMEKFILVQGREGLNRAIDGDLVALELLPESEWSAPSDIILQDETEDDPGDVIDDEKILAEAKPVVAQEKQPTGKIVGIIRRKWRQYCGILQRSALKENTRHLFVPAERKIPKVRIETRQAESLSTQRIIVAIDSWPRNARYPLGHFVRALGTIGDKDTENEVLLLEHDVPHSRFSEEVSSFLPQLPWIITEDVKLEENLGQLDSKMLELKFTLFPLALLTYADVIVHRLLAVCVGADATYPDLLDKKKSHALCHNLNYRNRMAQYAGRASVALNTHLFFRNKVQEEEGYILFVRKNALQILIPKFGLEGILYLSKKGETSSVTFVYDEEEHTQSWGNITFRSFDKVIVQLSLDRSNVQHEKLVFKLVKPEIPGFSIPCAGESMEVSETKEDPAPTATEEPEDNMATGTKRRTQDNAEEPKSSTDGNKGKKKRKKKY
ncbi:exosome complex exonuclease RRP44 [Copidosoma floridanum]|uniref:exosome complex exonuclease RRP44 n=1 Tax=Copidosoma floridanum TaxID=29053 RepID=UPI000C6F5EE7|nr:exosome complex exonuclease RRP44 [Copidosoma floridanum]